MNQRIYFLLLAILASIFVSGRAVSAEVVPGEYLVKYKDNAFASLTSIRSTANVRIMDHNRVGRIVKVNLNLVDEPQTLATLLTNPNVEYVVPNVRLRMFTAPVETKALKDQWAIKKVNAEAAWKRAGNKGSKNVVVAVIDTGVDYNHDSLKTNMVAGYDFADNDSDPYDVVGSANPGHGTHCAGVIGGTGLVDNGIVGLSPDVSIMPIRFLGEDGSGDLNDGIKAIDYAIAKGANVISASWGATIKRAQALPLIEAVKRADDAGVIFVVAASNDGRNNDKTEVYPANSGFPNMISVAASNSKDAKPSWSNYGKKSVHVAAPGVDIMSTLPGNKYGNLSGTSMATPLVAGLVALLKSQDSSLTGAQARALMQTTGAKVSIETACDCRVDAFAAVDALLAKKMFVTPAATALEVGGTQKFTATFGQAPFEFNSSNTTVGSITNEGLFTAVGTGETTITVKDSSGQVATSLAVRVGAADNGDDGNENLCPYDDPQICDLLCQYQPDLPWCQE